MKPFNDVLLILGLPMLAMTILILAFQFGPTITTEKHLRITTSSGQTYEVEGNIDYSSGQIQFRDKKTHETVQLIGTFSIK